MRLYLSILLFFTGMALAFPQIKISGRVLDNGGSPVEGFATLSMTNETSIISYAELDKNGKYVLTYDGKADSLCLRVSGMTIVSMSKVVANKTQNVDFTAASKEFDLKEVSVKAEPVTVSGDTIDYLTGTYTEQGDRVIGDVLRKIPGIEVSQSGGISYNGKPISKFYIEEMDMLQGRYGIAVNNINADDVSKVQVMKHHQPVKMLQNRTYTNDVAINLKLKDKAKGTFALNTALGAGLQQSHEHGTRGLWNEELTGMYFGKDRQTMQTYKGNNSADNILAELSNQYGGRRIIPVTRVGVLRPGTPNLPQKRYMNNQTHAISANWLERLSKDKEITFNISYFNDKQTRDGYTYTELYRPDLANTGIHETQGSKDKSNNLKFTHKYTDNAEKNYKSNEISVSTAWDDATVNGITMSQGYSSSVVQRYSSTPISIQDHAILQCLLGENIFRFHINAGYAQSGQTLNVMEHDTISHVQELMPRTFSLDASTSYEKKFGAIGANYGISVNSTLYGEDGTLSGIDTLSAEDSRNRMWYGIHRVSLFQDYSYKYTHGVIRLGVPLAIDIQTSNDRARSRRHAFFHPVAMASLSGNYEWNVYHNLHASAEYDQQVGDLNNLFTGYVMENYRAIVRSQTEKLLMRKSFKTSAGYDYSNALKQVFFNMSAGYEHNWYNQMESVVYQGIFANSVIQNINNGSSSLSASMGMNKNFDWLRSSIRWNLGYSHGTNQQMVDNQLADYRQNNGSASLSYSITPLQWTAVICSLGGSISKTVSEHNKLNAIKSGMGRLSLKFYPTNKFTITTSGECMYDNWSNQNKLRHFCDLNVKYAFKKLSLELEGNNLTNQRKYVLTRNNNMDIYHLEYNLRPINVLLKIRFKIL